jgi:hypothetical protein
MIKNKFFSILIIMILNFTFSCSSKKVEVAKSNCVSIFGGPCERIPVNDWWLKSGKM